MSAELCPLCKGSGSLLSFKPLTWWNCSACFGQGVIATGIIPPTIRAPKLELGKYAKLLRKARKPS